MDDCLSNNELDQLDFGDDSFYFNDPDDATDAIWGMIDYQDESNLRSTQMSSLTQHSIYSQASANQHKFGWHSFKNISNKVLQQGCQTELDFKAL